MNTLSCLQFTKSHGENRWHTFSLDRQIAVWASWGLHPAEPFLVWYNVSNYSTSVNLVPLTKQRRSEAGSVSRSLTLGLSGI